MPATVTINYHTEFFEAEGSQVTSQTEGACVLLSVVEDPANDLLFLIKVPVTLTVLRLCPAGSSSDTAGVFRAIGRCCMRPFARLFPNTSPETRALSYTQGRTPCSPCAANEFQERRGSTACLSCRTVGPSSETMGKTGSTSPHACLSCPQHALCANNDTMDAVVVRAKAGSYRDPTCTSSIVNGRVSSRFRDCPRQTSCLGASMVLINNSATSEFSNSVEGCAEGYTGEWHTPSSLWRPHIHPLHIPPPRIPPHTDEWHTPSLWRPH